MSLDTSPVLVPLGQVHDDPVATLVLLPGVGAGPGYFREWRNEVPDDWSVLSVNLPGRGSRFDEPFADRLSAVASEVSAALARFEIFAPVLFGHSFGALLGLEIARRLAKPPRLLATAGCPPPTPDMSATMEEPSAAEDRRLARGLLRQVAPELHGEVLEEMIEMAASVCRADMELLRGHTFAPVTLACDVLSFYAEHDFVRPEPWVDQTSGRAEVAIIAGDHLTLGNSSRAVIIDQIERFLRSGD